MALIGIFPSLQVCARCAAVARGAEVSVNFLICPKKGLNVLSSGRGVAAAPHDHLAGLNEVYILAAQ